MVLDQELDDAWGELLGDEPPPTNPELHKNRPDEQAPSPGTETDPRGAAATQPQLPKLPTALRNVDDFEQDSVTKTQGRTHLDQGPHQAAEPASQDQGPVPAPPPFEAELESGELEIGLSKSQTGPKQTSVNEPLDPPPENLGTTEPEPEVQDPDGEAPVTSLDAAPHDESMPAAADQPAADDAVHAVQASEDDATQATNNESSRVESGDEAATGTTDAASMNSADLEVTDSDPDDRGSEEQLGTAVSEEAVNAGQATIPEQSRARIPAAPDAANTPPPAWRRPAVLGGLMLGIVALIGWSFSAGTPKTPKNSEGRAAAVAASPSSAATSPKRLAKSPQPPERPKLATATKTNNPVTTGSTKTGSAKTDATKTDPATKTNNPVTTGSAKTGSAKTGATKTEPATKPVDPPNPPHDGVENAAALINPSQPVAAATKTPTPVSPPANPTTETSPPPTDKAPAKPGAGALNQAKQRLAEAQANYEQHGDAQSLLEVSLAACTLFDGVAARAAYRKLRGRSFRIAALEGCRAAGINLNASGASLTGPELLILGQRALDQGNPKKAYEFARESNRKARNPDAVRLMGKAACDSKDEKAARKIERMLRPKDQVNLRQRCQAQGVEL